jgi:23S rRNA (cytosine1962-C5)-methyltransferase
MTGCQQLLEAIRLRGFEHEDARRLFHGRSQHTPGLEFICVDWYAPVVLITLFGDAAEPWLPELTRGLRDMFGASLTCVLAQRRFFEKSPTEVLWGQIPEDPRAREGDLTFRLRLGSVQNTGFFLDMARGRDLVRRLAPGRRVLNLFAYTGAFSVVALHAGATHVVNLDMSRSALSIGRQNHLDNGLDPRRVSFLAHNLFKSFGRLRKLGPYDLIVIDPPTHQGQSFQLARDWPRILRRLPSLLAPSGDVIACLNDPKTPARVLLECFAEHMPGAVLEARYGPSKDFAEQDPETGLKVLHMRPGSGTLLA